MNDEQFDRLVRGALSWQADEATARQSPRQLALRKLAVRLSGSVANTKPRLRGGATDASSGAGRGRWLVAQAAGVAAVLMVAVVVVAYVFGPGSQPGATGPVHVSERHGYSLRLPDDSWQVTEWPGEWEIGTFLGAENPGSDYFANGTTGGRRTLALAWMSSQPIPPGLNVDGWLELQDRLTTAAAACFVLQGDHEFVLVGGERARVGVYYCPDFQASGVGWATVQVLFARDGRGYAMYFWPDQEPNMAPLAEVRLEALRWLSEFEFTEPVDGSPGG